jgi:signal transduction histidine kinase
MEQVVEVIVEKGLAFMRASEEVLALLNEDSLSVAILSSFDITPPLLQPLQTVPLTENLLITEAIRTGEGVWIEDIDEIVESHPSSYNIAVNQGLKAIAVLPLKMEGETIGGLSHGFPDVQVFNQETRTYLLSIAEQCAQAITRVQLTRKAQEGAALEERHRLARDLHDAVSQTLFATTLIADSVPQLWQRNPPKAMDRLKELTVLNRAAMGEMRALLLELRPDTILKTDLPRLMIQLLEAARGRRQIEVEQIIRGEPMIYPPDVHLTFYRIAQESISNIIKHS